MDIARRGEATDRFLGFTVADHDGCPPCFLYSRHQISYDNADLYGEVRVEKTDTETRHLILILVTGGGVMCSRTLEHTLLQNFTTTKKD